MTSWASRPPPSMSCSRSAGSGITIGDHPRRSGYRGTAFSARSPLPFLVSGSVATASARAAKRGGFRRAFAPASAFFVETGLRGDRAARSGRCRCGQPPGERASPGPCTGTARQGAGIDSGMRATRGVRVPLERLRQERSTQEGAISVESPALRAEVERTAIPPTTAHPSGAKRGGAAFRLFVGPGGGSAQGAGQTVRGARFGDHSDRSASMARGRRTSTTRTVIRCAALAGRRPRRSARRASEARGGSSPAGGAPDPPSRSGKRSAG